MTIRANIPTKNHKASFDSRKGSIYSKLTRTVNRDDDFDVLITTDRGTTAPRIKIFSDGSGVVLTMRQIRTILRAIEKHNS